MKINSDKSTQITFTLRNSTCPCVTINNSPIPVKIEIKYLGLHLDQTLTWKTRVKAKMQQLALKIQQMNWLIGRKSQLSIENKVLPYKRIIVPIWTYGIELWGCAKPSNTEIQQTFQSKTLRAITNAPWCVSNQTLHNDLCVPLVQDVIKSRATKYRNRNLNHQSHLVDDLFAIGKNLQICNRKKNLQ